uniref:Uncharacterized protein n=1 Tax=Bacteroides fragilis TaxID=817 RepID=A0A0I9UV18_BACFG
MFQNLIPRPLLLTFKRRGGGCAVEIRRSAVERGLCPPWPCGDSAVQRGWRPPPPQRTVGRTPGVIMELIVLE